MSDILRTLCVDFCVVYENFNESMVNDCAMDNDTEGMSEEELMDYIESNVNVMDDYSDILSQAVDQTAKTYGLDSYDLSNIIEDHGIEFDNNGDISEGDVDAFIMSLERLIEQQEEQS